jgi:hypothetical protein
MQYNNDQPVRRRVVLALQQDVQLLHVDVSHYHYLLVAIIITQELAKTG